MARNLLESELLPVSIASDPLAGAASDPSPFQMRKFSVKEYELIGQNAILTEDDNVELLEGWIVEKVTKNPKHEQVLYRLARAIETRLPPGFLLRNQSPVITDDSVPEPDLMIVQGQIEEFEDRHARVSEVRLVIEISDSSLSVDRRKRVLYARGGLATYWIVNIPDTCVEIYSDPITVEPAHYGREVVLTRSDTADILLADGVILSLPISEFLLKH